MMKKSYVKPDMQITSTRMPQIICSSPKKVQGNAGFSYGGASPDNQRDARSRSIGDWDSDEE